MELDRLKSYGVGCFLTDCIAIIDLVVDLRTGGLTIFSFLNVTMLSVISAVFIIALVKRDIRKKKERFQLTKEEKNEDASTGDGSMC